MAQPAPLPATLDPRAPFTVAMARDAGLTRSQLRGRSYRPVFTGVYATVAASRHPLIRIRAALLLHPPASFASHTSAASVYGAPLPAGHGEVHVTVVEAADRRRRKGIVHHLASPAHRVVLVDGIRVSAPLQMFVELADRLTLVDLIVVGDWLVRRGAFTDEELREHVATSRSAAACRAAGYVRAEVDSPMETRLRMLLVLAGLPEPVVNLRIRDSNGNVVLRFDLAYPELKIAVEYDGRQHRADLDQWDRDQDRQDWFDDRGWRHITVISRGIYRTPERTVSRVARALASRGVPVRPTDEWRAYFTS